MDTEVFVIVPRRTYTWRERTKGTPPKGYTLHRADCYYVKRVRPEAIMAAPAKAYPHTFNCTMCKPARTAASA